MRIVYFDLETRLHAADLNHEDEEAGWDALRRGEGGISALMIYDATEQWLYPYDDHSVMAAAKHLESADLVVGFRSAKFDVPVVEGILGRNLRLRSHYDIYTEIARANAHRGIVGLKGDFTLDAVCKRNIGRGKVEHGSNAKELAARGHWGRLFYYCGDDVHLTRDLFAYMCNRGGCVNNNRGFLSLDIPDWIRRQVSKETSP
jgi:DEAD/DEAH box helicase domain-containing protein